MLGGRVARMVAGLLLGLPGSLSATAGGDWYVDFSQGAAGDGSALNPFPTLAAAVSAAGEGDTIRIAGDGSASASAETPRITKGIRIEAEGGAVCIGALNAPTVTALTQAAAEQAILDAGFTVGTVTQAYSDTVAARAVISQSLAAGSHLAPGTAIDLVVSLGPALRANFIVYNNTFEGQVPLLVEFADTSQPGPHPIQTWAWDFDNDGVTDSTKQYPVHFYTKPGTYSVRLRVVSDDGTDELTRVNLVEAMPVDAPDGVSVDAGWFEMGDPWQEGASDELPVHDVFLSSYWLGQSEVTNGDYVEMLNWALRAGYLSEVTATTVEGYGRELMRLEGAGLTYSGNYFTSIYVNFGSLGESLITSYLPVVEVTWYGAAAYCNWLSEARGLTPCYNTVTWACDFSTGGYHLPTEAQWERAAAWDGTRHLRYGNGSDTIDCRTANYGYCNPLSMTSMPYLMQYWDYSDVASPVGCFSMSGNVREWCHGVIPGPSYELGPLVDPAPFTAIESTRVVRGGSWRSSAEQCRSSYRGLGTAATPYDDVGLRVARTTGQEGTQGPDLVASDLGVSRVAAMDWAEVTLSGTITNNGPVASGAFSVAFVVNGTVAATGNVDSVPAGACLETEVEATLPPLAAGDYEVVFEVDTTDVVEEPDETNNTYGPVLFTVGAPGGLVSVRLDSRLRFYMGDPWDEGEWFEVPVHQVTLSRYEIGAFEVTSQEYADLLNWAEEQGYLTVASAGMAEGYGRELLDLDMAGCPIGYDGAFYVKSREGHSLAGNPVVGVSWYGAAAYCNWLSASEGLTPCYDTGTWACDFSKDGYHLPTEAQWERAASWDSVVHLRYGNGSDSISCATANYHGTDYCNPVGFTDAPYTSPVGYYATAKSPVGCYDMCGNVSEWCNDWFGWYEADAVTNPLGPATGTNRVVRGGSWWSPPESARSAWRGASAPTTRANAIGFRIAR